MTQKINQFAVVDVETTGFGKYDRICEVGIVKVGVFNVDPIEFEIIDEFETLVNPKRDIGPVHVHNITASMVANAPTFEDIASGLVEHLNDSVLVAHNLPFDKRMIAQEFGRLNANFDPGEGVCTLNLTGEKLVRAAERHGIEYNTQHRALEDARVTAELFMHLFDDYENEVVPASVVVSGARPCAKAVVRQTASEKPARANLLIEQVCKHMRFPTSEEKILQYLNLLDAILADLLVDAAEQRQINDLMQTLELSSGDIRWANEVYLQTLITGAKRDNVVTEVEKDIMNVVANILDVPHQKIPSTTEEFVCARYDDGTRVCFTGTAFGHGNQPIERRYLELQAAKRGLQPIGGVTKKGCDLLVAQDAKSESGKAQKARKFGIEIISVTDFLNALEVR